MIMFSSLEALDAIEAVPVVARQGAFQPKAKPRARKTTVAATSSISPPPLPSQKSPQHPPPSEPIIDAVLPCIPQDFHGDSSARDHHNQAALGIGIASSANGAASQQTPARNDDGPQKTLNSTVASELFRETAPAESPLPPDISHNELGSPGDRASTRPEEANLQTVVNADIEECQTYEENADVVSTQNITGINTVLPDETVQERGLDIFTQFSFEKHLHPNALNVTGLRKDKKRRRPFDVQQEGNGNDKPHLGSQGNLEYQEADGKIRRQMKVGVKKVTREETVVETELDNSNQTSLQEDTEQRHSDAFELEEPVKSGRRCHRKSCGQQEATETVSPPRINELSTETRQRSETVSPPKFKEFSTETSKPRQRRLATFAAVSSVQCQQDAEMAANGDPVSEPVSQVEEGQGKKRLKRATETVSLPKINELSTETSKPRQRRLATFAAVSSVECQQDAEMAANEDPVSEPVLQNEEGQGKKRSKRATETVSLPKINELSTETSKPRQRRLATFAAVSSVECQQDEMAANEDPVSEPVLQVEEGQGKKRSKRATETVSPPKINELSTETSKPRQRRLATFAAVSSVEHQQDAEMTANGDPVSKHISQVEEDQGKKRLKRATLRKKKVEKRTLNPIDPNLDPKKLTMKDIIRLAEAKERKSKEGTARRSKDSSERKQVNGEDGEEPEHNERMSFAPQVHVVDGRIVINQESLTVAAHPVNDIRQYRRVEETHSKLNYHSYMKRTPKKVWRKEDTELFYKALREFGTNFALMQHLFPGRTRRQIFLKFKKEERACPWRLAEAMTPKPSEYSQFMEVINRLNIIPDKEHDSLVNEEASVLPETASTGQELEDDNTFLEDVSPPLEVAETDGLQMGIPMSKSENCGERTHASNTGADSEPVTNLTSAEDCEKPKEQSVSLGVKSWSSDQKRSSRPSKALFSYQHS